MRLVKKYLGKRQLAVIVFFSYTYTFKVIGLYVWNCSLHCVLALPHCHYTAR